MTTIQIEPAAAQDAPQLLSTQVDSFRDDGARFDPHWVDDEAHLPPGCSSLDWQLRMMKVGTYFSIRREGRILGGIICFRVRKGEYNLGRIWLEPAAQGRGLGRSAIEWVHGHFPDARRWTLDTPSWAVRNQHLYESLGYVKTGEAQEGALTLFLYAREVNAV